MQLTRLREIAVAIQRRDGTWSGWVEPLADQIRLDTARLRRAQRKLDRQHRAGAPGCFNIDGTHKTSGCSWERSGSAKKTSVGVAELHRRLAAHRKSLHGRLANQLFDAAIPAQRHVGLAAALDRWVEGFQPNSFGS